MNREENSESGSSSGSGRDSLSEFAFEMELPDMQDEGWIPDEDGWIPERTAPAQVHEGERRGRDSEGVSSTASDPRRSHGFVSNEVDWWQDLQQEHAAREQQHSARSRAASEKAYDVELLGSTPPH